MYKAGQVEEKKVRINKNIYFLLNLRSMVYVSHWCFKKLKEEEEEEVRIVKNN